MAEVVTARVLTGALTGRRPRVPGVFQAPSVLVHIQGFHDIPRAIREITQERRSLCLPTTALGQETGG